jgi:hypothetical protein
MAAPPFHAAFFCLLERSLIHRDAKDAQSHHTERASRADRNVNDAPPNEGPPIIDLALYRMSGVRHRDDTSERPGSMGASHLTAATPTAAIGGEAGLSFTCGSRQEK